MSAASRISGLRDSPGSRSFRTDRSFGGAAPEVKQLLLGSVEPAVGPEREGSIVQVSAFTGIAVVRDHSTKRRYKLSRRAVDSAIFDSLQIGSTVRFRDNGHNVVAALRITRSPR